MLDKVKVAKQTNDATFFCAILHIAQKSLTKVAKSYIMKPVLFKLYIIFMEEHSKDREKGTKKCVIHL